MVQIIQLFFLNTFYLTYFFFKQNILFNLWPLNISENDYFCQRSVLKSTKVIEVILVHLKLLPKRLKRIIKKEYTYVKIIHFKTLNFLYSFSVN